MRTRTLITGILTLPVNAVLFGIGATLVLSIPQLRAHMDVLLPAVIVIALALTVPIAWNLAPRLRMRNEYYPNLFRKSRIGAADKSRADTDQSAIPPVKSNRTE